MLGQESGRACVMTSTRLAGKTMKQTARTMRKLPERAWTQSGTPSGAYASAPDEKISPVCTKPPTSVPTSSTTMEISVKRCRRTEPHVSQGLGYMG